MIFVGAAGSDVLGTDSAAKNHPNVQLLLSPQTDFDQRLVLRRDGHIYQPWVASITFREDWPWFFDATLDNADDFPGTFDSRMDFFGVALHEIGHALGIGGNPAMGALLQTLGNGEDRYQGFMGQEASCINGGQNGYTPVKMSGGVHTAQEVRSNGNPPVMGLVVEAPRRQITDLDLAMLRDIGYKTTSP
ncbi:MAG: hypothetical protein IPJ88_17780 [Myxococcales bacterium]|nr:MAG: hypothetical protein IPJ88_17780 [Myxococcales bacterium]